MAKVSEWVDPSTVGGLTEGQEEEIVNLVSKSFGSSRIGLLKKAAALGKIKKFMGLPVGFEPDAKAIAEYIQSFPYQGQYQKQDIGAIYSSLSDKYGGGAFKLLGDPPTAEEVYSKIMFFSPESVSRSNITATGLDSYEGPIAETIEYKEDNGPEGVPVLDNADMSMDMMDLNYDLTPLYQGEKEFWANHPDPKFHSAQFTLHQERHIEDEERAEKERRARQYDAIAKKLWT